MAAGRFDRPIPGMSMTSPLGKYPYERPPEMTEVKEVFKYYMDRLADEETIDDFAMVCDMGVPLKPIVKTLLLSQQAEGKHSIDTGLIIAPILHEFLKQAIKATGVEVKDDDNDYQKEAEAKEMTRFKALTMKYISDIDKQGDPGVDLLKDLVDTEATVEEPVEETVEEKPQGLMARG